MKVQKSFENETAGAIYIVPTPIGNLEDITYRALNILKSAKVIAAEDTRNTRKLLNHFEISVPLISYHEHSKRERMEKLIEQAKNGDIIALVSDAGMPAISDPGAELVQEAIAQDIRVVVLPGANAALCALVGSGLPTDEFYFHGFLPRKKKEKIEVLERLKNVQATILFYESPFRVKDTLAVLNEQFGNRKVSLARELTKRFEEYIRGNLDEVLAWTSSNELKGEFVIVVEGSIEETAADDNWWAAMDLNEHVEYYMKETNATSKEAIKRVAADRKLSKREVYQAYHVEK